MLEVPRPEPNRRLGSPTTAELPERRGVTRAQDVWPVAKIYGGFPWLRGSSVRAMIVQLGEVAGTDLVENARRSPPIALASRRLDRFHVLCQMSLASVAAGIADAITAGRPSVVLPRRVAPLHHLRDLPNRMNDLLLAGRESRLDFSGP